MQPTELGRYRITGVLGRGGMGVVYEGHDPQIDRPVAIKTIALDALSEHEKSMFEARFRAEMRSAGRLQHHNIAALYDTGRDGGTAFIVMERVAGQDLRRRIAGGQRFSVPQALDITIQLLAALEFAHRRHVIHRDVKPANVMLQDDGAVKLCDFGVARLADADATRTQGLVVGSLRYASPEQISGQPIDARTDVFSTGVLLFELLTGGQPFLGQSDVEVLHRIATEAAPSPRSINPQVPVDIDGAVRRALAKNPDDRFASAAEFARALGGSSITSADTLPPSALSVPSALPAPPSAGAASAAPIQPRRRLVWAAAGASAAVLAVAAWVSTRPSAPATPSARAASAPTQAVRPPEAVSTPAKVAMAPVASAPALASAAGVTPVPAAVPGSAASVPVPRPTPAAPAAATVRPPDGSWRGAMSCGAVINPRNPGRDAAAFAADVAIHVAGARITMDRDLPTLTERFNGSFDAQGRFTADGKGARKDRAEEWRIRARGAFVPKSRRIEARVELVRPGDGSLARECTLVVDTASALLPAARAASAPTAPASPSPAPAARAQTLSGAQGGWSGLLSCGALLDAPPKSTRTEPFDAKLQLDVAGSTVTWTRESKTALEKGSGPLDANGRFTIEGNGNYTDGSRRSPWRLKARGEYLQREGRMQGQAQILRASDGSVARECTMRAERR